MTDRHPLCNPGASGSPAWVEALRGASRDLARVLDGASISVEVTLGGAVYRLGITAEGHVVFPLGGTEPADVVLSGDRREVAEFVLGQEALDQALLSGMLSAAPGIKAAALMRLREVVAARLRDPQRGGLHAAIGICATLATRIRSRLLSSANAALAEQALAAALMVVALGTPVAPASRAPANAAAHTGEVKPGPPVSTPPRAATARSPMAAEQRPLPQPDPRPSPARAAPSTGSRRLARDAKVQRPDGGSSSFRVELLAECNSAVRALVCSLLDAPPAATPAR